MSIRNTYFNYPVYIRSADRLSGEPANFRIKINPSRSFKNCLISIKDAIIPTSWYNVNSTNNVFTLREELAGGGSPTDVVITITPANYSLASTSFPTVLKNLLDTNSPNSLTYTVVYSSETGKLTISEASPTYNFRLIFSGDSQANILLGYDVDTTTSLAGSQVSDNVVDLSGTKAVYIKMNLAYDSGYETSLNQPTNILQKIPITVNSFDVVDWTNLQIEDSRIISQAPLDSFLNIQLIDDDGVELDMNGVDWSFTLLIQKERSKI